MSNVKFTDDQLNAIYARGGTILVSAAAGSGKTAVLVERVISLITDPTNPVDADRLVIVTFTKAAAGEMRERIDKRLTELIRDNPDSTNLRRQKTLIARTHIDTIHSFCSSCLREFFARAGIAPDFRVADDSEIRSIRAEALSELIDSSYSSGSEEFLNLVSLLGSERDDNSLETAITELEKFINAYPDPEAKLREYADMYDCILPAGQTVWGKWCLRRAAAIIEHLIELSSRALDEITLYEEFEGKFSECFEDDIKVFENIRSIALAGDWDGFRSAIKESGYKNLPKHQKTNGSKFKDDPDYNRINGGRSNRKDTVKALSDLISVTESEFAEDMHRVAPVVKTLCSLTAEYRRSIAQRKAERKLVDFDDLEHMTAALLVEYRDGHPVRTETAKELSERYTELLIDEYQDTNYTQDLIFRAISKEPGEEIGEGGNLFLVGDIKQSIYGFRKAVPQLFLDRLNAYAPYNRDCPVFPAKIILDRNFRSRPEVTEAVNFIFRQIMTAERGGIVYNEEQRLVARDDFPCAEGVETELHLFSLKDDSTDAALSDGNNYGEKGSDENADDDAGSAVVEARYCARLVKQMVGNTMVTDGNTMRPAEYRDFCIMRRGVRSGAAKAFIEQFEALGVPISANVDEGFFLQSEVCVMLSLLRAVNNPLLDVPLTAALRSPVFGFDSNDLARLRADSRKQPVYLSLCRKAEEGDMLCGRAAELLTELRNAAASMPCDRLLRTIYNRTGYLAVVQAMPNGRERRGNLLMLLEFAATSESTGAHGLHGFLDMMERMEKENKVDGQACPEGNRVTMHTMHKAKGLQFPICIVTGLGKEKNKKILSAELPIHERLGIGARVFDLQRRMKYNTVQREAIRLARYADEVDEELRVLYVALTRAVDKLIMISAADRRTTTQKTLQAAADDITEKGISPLWLEKNAFMGRWLTACALRHPDSEPLRREYNVLYGAEECNVPLQVKIIPHGSPMLAPITPEESEMQEEHLPDEEIMAAVRDSMEYGYISDIARVPAKVTASQTHRYDGDVSEKDAALPGVSIRPVRPSFMSKRKLSPTERGTALHHFMQFCDLEKARTDTAAEVERLVASRFITRQEGDAVDSEKVAELFGGELGRLIASAKELHREWRFTAELKKERLPLFTDADAPEEMVVLQGECDLLLIMENEAVVVDYKTDKVKSTDELLSRYTDQLTLYADAVGEITGLPVSCYIYSFTLSELRKLDNM